MSSGGDGGAGAPGARAAVDDALAGALLAVLAVLALVWLIPANTASVIGEYDVSPTFFPELTATVVLLLAIALLLSGLARMRRPAEGARSSAGHALLEFGAWSVAATLAVLGIAKLGFVVTAAALIAAAMLLAGRRTWYVIAIAAIGFPLLVDAVAWWVFTVDLP